MAKNHIQPGQAMPYTNATGSPIASGAVVIVGVLCCIALGDIADGATGEVATEEVWEVPKAAPLVIDQGDAVYWDVADGNINKTEADNVLAGVAFADAASADTTVKIKLNV
jgi:predicted RecA/RadA family phage recombinase